MNVLVNRELGEEKRTNLQKHASQIQADAAGQSPGTPALHNTADCGSGIWERSQEGTSADYLNVSLYLICTSKGDGRRQPHRIYLQMFYFFF